MGDWIDELPEKYVDKVKSEYRQAKDENGKFNILRQWHPKGIANPAPIRNLEEFFRYIRYISNETCWFRGESKEYEHLVPKLFREVAEDKIEEQLKLEHSYFHEFRRRSRSLTHSIDPNDIWSWYFLIQHYGGPTRLLDWTQDAATALFFSVDSPNDSVDDAFVIVLQPTALTSYAFAEVKPEASIIDGSVPYPGEFPTDKWIQNILSGAYKDIPNSPVPLLPQYSDPRITAQRSCFTLFGKRQHGFVADESMSKLFILPQELDYTRYIICPCCGKRVMHKLVIDGTKKGDIRRELAKIGVTSGKIYPGLEGLCKELNEEFNRVSRVR